MLSLNDYHKIYAQQTPCVSHAVKSTEWIQIEFSILGLHWNFRLATGWMVRGSKPGWGGIFHIRPDLPGPHPASYTMGIGSFPVIKRPGRGFNHLIYLRMRLKKEYCCTSTPSLASWQVIGWNLPFTLPLHREFQEMLISFNIFLKDKLYFT